MEAKAIENKSGVLLPHIKKGCLKGYWDVCKHPEHGKPIPGSKQSRGFCIRCVEPLRGAGLFCIDCDPPHIGCSSPQGPDDPDAYGTSGFSTQNDYGDIPGD